MGSLNSIRSYISDNAKNKSTVYGVFYGGIAIFNSIGAVIIGLIWKNYGENIAIYFSITGLIAVLMFYKRIVK